MPNTTSPYFYPSDSWSDQNKDQISEMSQTLPLRTIKEIKVDQVPLYPIDETDDFHDPFSDLSLFLSRKIKKIVEQSGSTKQWSTKIQTDLLKHILPEFTVKFPKYRIGLAAIRKVWEKVSYFYGKVQTQKEALHSDGQLNIDYMIKENLRSAPKEVHQDLPFYHHAHQLGVRLCEYIATVDGVRPSLDHLTKVIWATQKHLLKNLPQQRTKNAFEEYDLFDKILIKSQLEALARSSSVSKEDLGYILKNTITSLRSFSNEYTYETLYQEFACILSEKFYQKLSFIKNFKEEDHNNFKAFISRQLDLCDLSKRLKDETKTIETVQRILSLYPLITSFARFLTEGQLRKAIQNFTQTNQAPLTGEFASILGTFIQAELHFLKRKNSSLSKLDLEEEIVITYRLAKEIPLLDDVDLSDLEIYVWHTIHAMKLSSQTSPTQFKRDAFLSILDHANASFKTLLYQLVQQYLKVFEALKTEDTLRDFSYRLERKIHLWTIQNAMVFRSVHIDEQMELFKLLKTTWLEQDLSETTVCHKSFTQTVLTAYLEKHPHMTSDQDLVLEKIQLLYLHFWYHHLLKDTESSLDRWVLWHTQDIRCSFKDSEIQQKIDVLEKRFETMLPLTPYAKKGLEEAIA